MKIKTVLVSWVLTTLSLAVIIWLLVPLPFWKVLAFTAIGLPFFMMLVIGFIAIVTTIQK